MLKIRIQPTGAAQTSEVDALALAVLDPPSIQGLSETLDGALDGRLTALCDSKELKGARGKLLSTHTHGLLAATRLCVAGLGKPDKLDSDALRTAAARGVAATRAANGTRIAWYIDPELDLPVAEQARALTEGTALSIYDAGAWKTVDPRPKPIAELVLIGDGLDEGLEAAERAAKVCHWANHTRRLVDAPANEITPEALAEDATRIANEHDGLECEIWGPDEIRSADMGAFAAVGQASVNEPRMIVLRWSGPGAAEEPLLGLVGKGITFDTGGISIKPAARMADMKGDMAGAAAVLGAMGAIAALGVPVSIIAVIAASENMLDGKAYRPGDILTARNGKTIEVTNTDAEGRLVMADALTYCREQGATHMLDLATLTGAVVTALGDFYAGLMGNDQTWVDTVAAAASESGDHAWQLPMHSTYRRHIGSTYADFKNSSDIRAAGSIYAASFLSEFTGDGPWAHLDIAGTGHLDRSRGDYYTGAGATGYGVRLLVELASALAEPA
ncbi:MAG: leucyl aminopeptidase [Gaiellaceae bacterium]